MKTKNILLTYLFLLPLVCLSNGIYTNFKSSINQNDPQINQTDKDGKKQGKWIYFGKDQPEKGYPMDGKISEGKYKDSRKNGKWIIYFKDGVTPKLEGEYVDNRPDGPYVRYHQNGQIKEIATFSQQKYKDSLLKFNDKGIMIFKGNYNDEGNESGKIQHFYDNGQPQFVYEAKDGVPTGKAVRYWPNGDIKEEMVFDENGKVAETTGEIEMKNAIVEDLDANTDAKKAPKVDAEGITDFEANGYNKVMNQDRELWMEGEFKNGRLWDGRLYVYDEDGLLLKVEVYRKGKYHSDGQL